MEWKALTQPSQLEEIIQESLSQPVMIFKHSTRCSISTMAMGRLERGTLSDNLSVYYLDLLTYRPISSEIAERFSVHHESPQVLLIRNGECVYVESHNGIDVDEINAQAEA
jgi:bacillithiol system protein YtxJ